MIPYILIGRPTLTGSPNISLPKVAMPERLVDTVEGVCEGEVIPDERGNYGFGYDPIFLVQTTGLTMAELQPDIKNRISHRALAIRRALPVLTQIFPELLF